MRVGYKKRKGVTIASLLISGLIIAGMIFFVNHLKNNADVENEIILSETSFEIKGLYGESYNYADIEEIEMKDTLPEIEKKHLGIALGGVKKGDFDMEELGLTRMHVLHNEGPYLYIKFENRYLILNHLDKQKTDQLYSDLMQRVK
ncbi:hypothetical protein I5677_07115 [Mobilitalea sibirica]|uniref:Bacterial Pleckstrin homology domain-containing protein n=1 Tax=Mobilitalea sibirica TaxID=1462919 RepID=A0A8J7H8Z1_9FIRM|nr:hypothetical protein [Mobilitalea sibirica]MBH1940655.1 hypothetical protein [Mobilitalea sibirica]